MDPNTEGLVKATPEQVAHSDRAIERLYEAAQALSISEKATLIHRLIGASEEITAIVFKKELGRAARVYKIGEMTLAEIAELLDILASELPKNSSD